MKLALLAIGRLKGGPEQELFERYRNRIISCAAPLGFSKTFETREWAEKRADTPDLRRAQEAQELLHGCREAPFIAFDERGISLDSLTFAHKIATFRDQGAPRLSLVIGGADGLDETIRQKASLIVSFGALTLPHQLVRVLVAEQLYRTMTILSGHPYHRGE